MEWNGQLEQPNSTSSYQPRKRVKITTDDYMKSPTYKSLHSQFSEFDDVNNKLTRKKSKQMTLNIDVVSEEEILNKEDELWNS